MLPDERTELLELRNDRLTKQVVAHEKRLAAIDGEVQAQRTDTRLWRTPNTVAEAELQTMLHRLHQAAAGGKVLSLPVRRDREGRVVS